MPPETRKLLIDIQGAAAEIFQFTLGMDFSAYIKDAKCRAAVERKFEIMGEACTRIRDRDPDAFEKLPYGPQVIGLRNRVIHGYDSVDDLILWDVISTHLNDFIAQVDTLANE
jgi:uncharacterized protein with HEPN domain